MRSFFKSSRFKGFLGVFGVLLLAVFFAAVTNDSASPASDVLGTVFMPLQSLSARIANGLEDFSLHFRSAASYAERVKELEKQVAGYQEQLVDYEKSKQ